MPVLSLVAKQAIAAVAGAVITSGIIYGTVKYKERQLKNAQAAA